MIIGEYTYLCTYKSFRKDFVLEWNGLTLKWKILVLLYTMLLKIIQFVDSTFFVNRLMFVIIASSPRRLSNYMIVKYLGSMITLSNGSFFRVTGFVRGNHRSPVNFSHIDTTHLIYNCSHRRLMLTDVKLLRPKQNGRHFPEDIFKWIFLNDNVWISINISLKFVPKGPINNIPALVPIMAWRRPGDKPLSEPVMVSLLTQICVTRPQWVKNVTIGLHVKFVF